jgi:hypothetical protein
MSQKINSTQKELPPFEEEFTPSFLPSLIILTLIVLAVVVFSEHAKQARWVYFGPESRPYTELPKILSFSPAVMLPSGKTVADGILAFSGKPPAPLNLPLQISLLASIIVSYIIIPAVFFFNWRRHRVENKSLSTKAPLNFSSIIYALSIIFTLSISVAMTELAISSYHSRQSFEQAMAIQLNKDETINDLNLIALNAYQYKLLPKEFGGGQGKYIGFIITPERAKTQNCIYTVTTGENQVTIKAQSLQFPSGIIHTTVNEQGQTGDWQFEGMFK